MIIILAIPPPTPSNVSLDVLCEICYKYRNAKNYKRHLRIHLNAGAISLNKMNHILFQTRYSRTGSYSRQNTRRYCKRCAVLVSGVRCGSIVLDLATHMRRVHGIATKDERFGEALKVDDENERKVFFMQGNIPKRNPMHNFETSKNFANYSEVKYAPIVLLWTLTQEIVMMIFIMLLK